MADRTLTTPLGAAVPDVGVSARWYVMVTTPSGDSVFATMGPYPDETVARDAADGARVVHYRVGRALPRLR